MVTVTKCVNPSPVQDVGVRGGEGGVGPARQSGTSRGGQSWLFLIIPTSSVYSLQFTVYMINKYLPPSSCSPAHNSS